MTLSASTVWEFASGGSMNNGGGYVTTEGSTDYSLAAPTPALALTNCYHEAGSTTLTSDTGGFTTAMIGNLLKVVSGTNFTVGWFEIKTRIDSYNITVDDSLGASANTNKDGVVNVGGALAYGIDAEDTAFHTAVIAGNTIWYNGGNTNPGTTFTIAGNVAVGKAGSYTSPIVCRGYKLTRGDACNGAYRPTIACGAYTFVSATHTNWTNLQFTGTAASVWSNTTGCCILFNCKSTNSSATTTVAAFIASTVGYCAFVGCEASSPAAIAFSGVRTHFIGCYAHDSKSGIKTVTAGQVMNCVVETCGTFGITATSNSDVMGNTVRNCGIGIYSVVASSFAAINNIVTDCFVGVQWDSAVAGNLWAYNCLYDNTTPRTNVTAVATDIATDPVLTSAIGKGTDGASVATSKVFTAASGTPFADVTTSDYLAIFAGTGTGIKLAVYAIASVDSNNQLTLTTDPTNAVNNISGCTFGVVKGSDFTLGATSSCIDAALDAQTYSGVTV